MQNSLFSADNIEIVSTIIAEMAYLSQIFFVVVQLSQVVVEIVKATYFGPKIVVIDETTTALSGEGREEKREYRTPQ